MTESLPEPTQARATSPASSPPPARTTSGIAVADDSVRATNPWGVVMLVGAGLFVIVGLIVWSYGDISANATFDNATGPTHDQLALIQHITGLVLVGFGVLTVLLRIAVEAVRWTPRARD
ncbi:hypothetical protein [Frondihabitans australicus]|uniref:Uncharacterized protein n=1 Tax=Frondihabitans australicus TaxID=386892 RepID=A0A495IG79_9MICO|nr:hypothetical protein [Frondihabitans australicus]RKR74205.1 hypothetical protein C8E83_1313 [Frondihabitans australicus]